MRRDSFERFYYEKVALEGCGCAEYVTTRMRDLDGLAVKAKARGIAWSAPELRPVWLQLADRIRKVAEGVNWRSESCSRRPLGDVPHGLMLETVPVKSR